MPDRKLKTGDTWPPLEATLTDEGGVINLTAANSVRVIMKSGATIVSGDCDVVDATNGEVEYVWAVGDTNIPGTYEVEFEITWDTNQIETVPNDKASNPKVIIGEDLD